MRKRGKNLFKKDLEPNFNLRKLTFSLSVLVIVLGSVLVYRSIEAGELQAAFFPNIEPATSMDQGLGETKIEVTNDNTNIGKSVDTSTENQTTYTNNSSNESDSNYFLNYGMERDSTRAQQVEMLNDLIDNKNTDVDVKKKAQEKLLKITDALEDELLLTNLLNAKYSTETAVFVQDGEVNVIMKSDSDSLSQQDVEKIAQIVDSQTNVGYENVVIILKK